MQSNIFRYIQKGTLARPLTGLSASTNSLYLSMYKMPSFSTHFSLAMFSSRFGHQVKNEIIFKTDNNAYSRMSQKGLYHGKTHGPKFRVCFSDKRHRFTQKPNVFNKRFQSEILGIEIRLPTSTTALRTIRKVGGFDNYILNTRKSKMNSKIGMYIRDLMIKKLNDPDFEVPYIPFQAKLKKRARRRPKYLENMPTVYIPAHMKQNEDFTKWHDKTPDEMTRDEIADFEAMMKDPDVNLHKDKEWKKKQPEYIKCKEEMYKLQPLRHDIIRKYWSLNKNNEEARTQILQLAEESEEFPKYMLEEDYIHFREAIPEIDIFLQDIERKKRLEIRDKKMNDMEEIHLRIGNKLADFNPFEGRPEHIKESPKIARKEWK